MSTLANRIAALFLNRRIERVRSKTKTRPRLSPNLNTVHLGSFLEWFRRMKPLEGLLTLAALAPASCVCFPSPLPRPVCHMATFAGLAAKRLYPHLKGSKSTVLQLIPQHPLNLALQVFHLRQDFAFQLGVVGNPGVLGADPADGGI